MTDRRKPTKPTEPQPPQRKYGKVYGGGKSPHPPAARKTPKAESPPSPAGSASPPPPESPAADPEDPARKAAADEVSLRLPRRHQHSRLCRHGHRQGKGRAGKWRIAEGTLFALAALGGALGGTLGMRVFHHKTKHKEFRFGFPALLCLQCAAVVYLILIWKQVL